MAGKKKDELIKKESINLPPLSKVLHAKFGIGTIEERIGHVYRVTFKEYGTMRVHRNYLAMI
jgi:hypothetical protein